MKYFEVNSDLKYVDLENSFILAISINKKSISFFIQAVLLQDHEKYSDPKSDEKYCYNDLVINFNNFDSVAKKLDLNPIIDPDGTFDLGQIDSFLITDYGFIIKG
jgi:hypothetical protein